MNIKSRKKWIFAIKIEKKNTKNALRDNLVAPKRARRANWLLNLRKKKYSRLLGWWMVSRLAIFRRDERRRNEKNFLNVKLKSDFESTKEEKPIGIIYCNCRHENFNVWSAKIMQTGYSRSRYRLYTLQLDSQLTVKSSLEHTQISRRSEHFSLAWKKLQWGKNGNEFKF